MTYYSFDGAFQNLNSAIDGIGKRLQEQRDTEANLAAFDAWQRQSGQAQPQQPVAAPARSPLLSLGRGDDYFGRTASAESSNDPNARNPRSSATGLHQFLRGTWDGLMKSNPELGLTADGRTDPEQSNRAMRAFTAQNADALRAKGVEPNDRNLYVAHFLGAGAAPNFIGAVQQDPSVPAASLVSAQVAAANRPVFFNRDGSPKTAGEVYERMTARFGNGSTAVAALGGGQPAPVQVAQAGGDTRADLPPQGADAGQAQGFAIPGAQPATRQNSAPFVRSLIANPATRGIGMQLWQQAMTGKQFGFQVVGDQLYRTNPTDGSVEPVGITNPKTQLEMEAMRLANRKAERELQGEGATALSPEERKQLGITDTQAAYKTRNGEIKFGPAGTTVNVGAEKSYDQTTGKAYGEQFVGIQKDARDAVKTIGTINMMEKLIQTPGFYSGLGGDRALAMNQALVTLGIKDAKAATAQEAFKALSNQLVLDAAGGSLGAQISNGDRDYINATAPNLANTPEGNKELLGMRRKVAERQGLIGKMARDYAKANGGRIDAGFEQQVAEFAEANPLFPRQQPTATPSAVREGSRARGPNGQVVTLRNGQWVPE